MTDISLHRRLMRKRVVPEFVSGRIRFEQDRAYLMSLGNFMEPPTKWQRFVEAWARFKA